MSSRVLLWTIIEPRGLSVSLAEDVWQHIVTEHPTLASHFDVIRTTVEDPDEICFDAKSTASRTTGAQVYAYYKAHILSEEFEDDIVYVSVKFVQEAAGLQGYVQTALATRGVQKRMRRVWHK